MLIFLNNGLNADATSSLYKYEYNALYRLQYLYIQLITTYSKPYYILMQQHKHVYMLLKLISNYSMYLYAYIETITEYYKRKKKMLRHRHPFEKSSL